MDRVSSLLPKVLRKRGLKDEADAALLVHTANRWLHRNGFPNIEACTYSRGTLLLEAHSSVDAQECHARIHELGEALQNALPTLPVGSIRILRERRKSV